PGVELATPLEVFWLFALGWAAAKATRTGQRLLVSLAVVATLPGFFENQYRVAVVIAGLLVLLWVPQLPSLRPLHRPVGLTAGRPARRRLPVHLPHPLADLSASDGNLPATGGGGFPGGGGGLRGGGEQAHGVAVAAGAADAARRGDAACAHAFS